MSNWRDDALCLPDPEGWFPVGHSPAAEAQARAAKRICRTCPSLAECGEWSLTTRPRLTDGIFAGLDGDDRAGLWRAQSRQDAREREARPIAHGTEGGYRTHRRRGEDACASCLGAATLAARERRS